MNRFSESPHPLGKSLSEESMLSTQSRTVITKEISLTPQSSQEESQTNKQRQQPIPEPSHPRQYRAIGLIEGHYEPSEDHLTRGTLLTAEGKVINTVMLGRMISVIKKHLDLEESHLWVVYPRTQPDTHQLHLQIVGIWEPETLAQGQDQPDPNPPDPSLIKHGYFSIRGEVIYSSFEQQKVIIKIKQAPKNEGERTKFFKLQLKGTLPPRPVSRFWDLQVQLQGDTLVIQQATDLGFVRNKKPFDNRKKPFSPRGQRRPLNNSRVIIRGKTEAANQQPPEQKFTPKLSQIIKKKTN